ncbi:MAG: ferrous iron transport protein B [Bacteroidia bacterium]|nr:ferrous iron transport protein B [Bacteroidia bacterium]
MKVALAGNPNSGKSTLFNLLTGLHQKVANFPGVTVEKKTGHCRIFNSNTGKPTHFEIIDLPGTYSLYPKSPDERIPFEILCDPANASHPDIVVLLVDGTNLKRSLFLASQVIDLKIPCVIALNMMDLVKKENIVIQVDEMERRLGVRVIPINGRSEEGMEELKQVLVASIPVPEKDIFDTAPLAPKLLKGLSEALNLRSNYAALQIAHHADALDEFHYPGYLKLKAKGIISENETDLVKMQSYETLERYKVIQDVMNSAVSQGEKNKRPSITQRIDRLMMHRFWGYIFFLTVLFLIFQTIFSLAEFPMNFIDETFTQLSDKARNALPQGMLNDLLVDGVLAGVGGIIIFIPQIALLFMFIAILEDTGYMARVSFLMDKLMRKFGLNGRSVIPLMSGAACAVPAILSTRTIGSWRERLITIFVTPLMSCSARLPVYTLLIALVVPQKMVFGFIGLQGLVMMSLYLIGFLAAIASAALFKNFVKVKEKAYFIMEIPVYRMPRWNNVLYAIAEKVRIFLFDAGKIIVAISIVLWFLSSRGPGDHYAQLEKKSIEMSTQGMGESPENYVLQSEMLEASYAGKLGHLLEPAIRPLGFDWKIGIALVTSFAAREVFVGTMSTIYSVGQSDADAMTVKDKMKYEINPDTGGPRYTAAVGWSLMLFYAFAMQCMSTMAVVRRETGSWKWPLIQFAYFSALAWISSFLAYQVLS